MGIKLPSRVALRHIHQREIPKPGDLCIDRGLNPMGAFDSSSWDETCSVAVFEAPGDFDTFGVANYWGAVLV
jgi:hypothetical protein